jgi:hypothetical protein
MVMNIKPELLRITIVASGPEKTYDFNRWMDSDKSEKGRRLNCDVILIVQNFNTPTATFWLFHFDILFERRMLLLSQRTSYPNRIEGRRDRR